MFGIPGLDGVGLIHSVFGIAALFFGLSIVMLRKGTYTHRRIGQCYAASLLLVNLTAFTIYDLYGRFGPFHVAALVSLATLLAAFVPVYLRRPRGNWIEIHGTFMGWSYIGLFAAFLAEMVVRVPGMRFSTGVIAATAVAIGIGVVVIHTRVPKIAASIAKSISSRASMGVGL